MVKKKIGLMVDLETWGTQPDCVIRQIAMIPFYWDTLEAGDPICFYPDEQHQTLKGRKFEMQTIKWWSMQNKELNNKLTDDQLKYVQPCSEVATAITLYLDRLKKKFSVYFVARGANTFDYPILDSFMRMFSDTGLGFAYYRIYDLRSLTSILKCCTGHDFTENKEGKSHNAIYDCKEQIEQIRRVKKQILPF